MPNRQIPWKQVAAKLGGTVEVDTGLTSTSFVLRATVDGVAVRVSGHSQPYDVSIRGGSTEVQAAAPTSLGTTFFLGHQGCYDVSFWRRFVFRDVVVGDPTFDASWVINAKRESGPQAFLDSDVRRLVEAVPPAMVGELPSIPSYYNFEVRPLSVRAASRTFEQSAERMEAAIRVAVALARKPEELLGEWRRLSRALDGRILGDAAWGVDGALRVQFPMGGKSVSVSPIAVRTGRRRDRLRTRIFCDLANTTVRRRMRVVAKDFGEETLGVAYAKISDALADAKALAVENTGRVIQVDLDGNITDAARITAAASAVVALAHDGDATGPYR